MEEKIDYIDELLNILLNNMEYEDYINFIKSNDVLKAYDDILGKTDINHYPSQFRNMITDEVTEVVEKIVKDKITELGLDKD